MLTPKFKLLTRILFEHYKIELFYLQIIIFLSSILQILSILSFGPFIIIITNASNVQNIYDKFSFLENFSLNNILFLSICFVTILFMVNNILSIYVSKIIINFCKKLNINFSNHLYKHYLLKNYLYHAQNSSSEIISKITLEVSRLIINIINPLIQLNSKIIMALFILLGLNFVSGIMTTSIALLIISFSYALFFSFYKKQLKKNSKLISDNLYLRQKIIKESLQNIIETKFFKVENFFIKNFDNSNSLIAKSIAKNQFLSIVPKYLIEILGILILMIFIFYKINIGKSLNEILPILAIYLVAGYKLIPAIQGIATAYASIKGNQTAMDSTLDGLSNLDANYFIDRKIDKLEFKKLNLLNISFSYGSKEILENIDLEIKKEQFTGIIGKTGVGKSTLIHIVSGLLEPTKGEIKIDGKNLLKKDQFNLLNEVGYVPQKISLNDDTILSNIAIGVKKSEIDYKKIEFVTKVCQLNEFVENLPEKLESYVGEDGVLLSGGQIQRIGLARALYFDPSLIIIDEGTSGLDENTQNNLISSLKNFTNNISVLIVTHRNEILKFCDQVYKLENKKIYKIK